MAYRTCFGGPTLVEPDPMVGLAEWERSVLARQEAIASQRDAQAAQRLQDEKARAFRLSQEVDAFWTAFYRRCRRPYNPHRSDGSTRIAFSVAIGDRLAIYERDNWVCQLCKNPVDPTLRRPDPGSASLDHIECQSWVLIPDHSPGNLQLAHLGCNMSRGNRPLLGIEQGPDVQECARMSR